MSDFRADLLADKVAIITGGGTGLGKQIAHCFGQHGARIVICSRKAEILEAARAGFESAGFECLAITADIREPQAVETVINRTIDQFGQLDILVNNAAGNFPATLDDISYNGFKTIVDIDLLGTYNFSKAAYEAWFKRNGGCVVNITAPFEHWGVSYQAHVAAAKTGVESLTRTCAVEWAGKGIRVNTDHISKNTAQYRINNPTIKYVTF